MVGLTGVIFPAAALVSGCGSMDAENALAQCTLKTPDAGVTIFRAQPLIGAAGAARVRVDGRDVANLGVGESTTLDVPARTHKIVVDHPSAHTK
jgi:hypothetical protein